LSSHQQQFGIKLNTFLLFKNFQINAESVFSLYPKTFGNRKRVFERKSSIGILGLWGNHKNNVDFEFGALNHQGFNKFALGYSYIWYRDNTKTSQNSGALGLHIDKWSLIHENDFFSGKGKDRFRTGKMHISFQDSLIKYQSGFVLWTGETNGSIWNKTKYSKCPNGYRDLHKLPYGKTSHGVLYFGVSKSIFDQNSISFQMGWDSEQIRHIIQNKFIHDMPLIPKNIARKTPHYPRLDKDGLPTFNKDDTRKTKIFYSYGWNNY